MQLFLFLFRDNLIVNIYHSKHTWALNYWYILKVFALFYLKYTQLKHEYSLIFVYNLICKSKAVALYWQIHTLKPSGAASYTVYGCCAPPSFIKKIKIINKYLQIMFPKTVTSTDIQYHRSPHFHKSISCYSKLVKTYFSIC